MEDEEDKKELVERPNKERLKRETQALKDLVLQLMALSPRKLDDIPLNDIVRTAVVAARTMKRTALKRQIKYIVGQMRAGDVEAVERELYLLAQPHKAEVQAFHKMEQWREALIDGDDTLIEDLIERFPAIDRQQFRQLIRNSRKEKEQGKTPKTARLLFRYLVELQAES